MTPKTEKTKTLTTTLIDRWEQAGSKLAALADEFPAGKFETKPVDGTRTVGEVLRHVAFWNRFVADTLRGKQADESSNELPKNEYSSRARILDALRRSTADAATALRGCPDPLEPKAAEMVLSFIEHTSEHYGQLVVYARLNGITPPASAGN